MPSRFQDIQLLVEVVEEVRQWWLVAKDPPVRSGSGVPVALCVSLAIVGTAGVVLAKEKGRNGGSGGGASSSSSSSGSYAYHMYAGGSGGGGDAGPSRGGHRGHPNGGRGPPAQQSRPPGGGGQRQPPSRQTLALPRVQKLRERPLPEQKPEPLGRPPPPPPPPPPPSNTAPPGEDDDSPKPPEEYNISGALVFALVLGLIAKHYFPQQEKERDWPEIINTTDVDLSGSSEMMKEFIETAAQLNIKTDEFDVLELLRDGLAAQAVVLPSVLEDVSVGGTNASPLRSKVVPAGLSPLLAKVNVVPTRAPDPIAAPWWRRKRNIEDYWMIYRLGCALLFALLERVRVPKVKLRSAFRTAEAAAAADQTRRVGLDFDKMCAVYDQEVPPLVFMESAGFFLEPLLNSYSFRMKGKPRCSGLYKDSVWVKTTTDWVWDYHPFFNVGSDNFDAREVQWNEWTEVRYFEPVKEVEKGEHMEIIKVRPPWLRSSVHASPSAYPSGSGHGHGHGSPSGPGPGPPSSSYNAATSLSSPLSAPSTPERSPSRPLRPPSPRLALPESP
ncbi:hypothetical protein NLJ89_g3499 [Agrocybe chaxingu]|uniref:Uncharacterized protein n=1 Tax=Agrocybe chaxingu TaxID=84603 RepID=A0A9W8K4R9_9AGAR|nr:hypothetical protein NLJ89_g3499 [Agrocybe chaxingu]